MDAQLRKIGFKYFGEHPEQLEEKDRLLYIVDESIVPEEIKQFIAEVNKSRTVSRKRLELYRKINGNK